MVWYTMVWDGMGWAGNTVGDDPPRDRTAELRKLGFPTRHLGSVQMTTDTALGVTKKVVDDCGASNLIYICIFPLVLGLMKD